MSTKQPKSRKLWQNDGSCVQLLPGSRDHVRSHGSVHLRTNDGRAFRTLNILNKHSLGCLAIRVKRKLKSTEVINALTDLFILRDVPSYKRMISELVLKSPNGDRLFMNQGYESHLRASSQVLPAKPVHHLQTKILQVGANQDTGGCSN